MTEYTLCCIFLLPLTLLKQIWDVCVVVSILMFDYDKKI